MQNHKPAPWLMLVGHCLLLAANRLFHHSFIEAALLHTALFAWLALIGPFFVVYGIIWPLFYVITLWVDAQQRAQIINATPGGHGTTTGEEMQRFWRQDLRAVLEWCRLGFLFPSECRIAQFNDWKLRVWLTIRRSVNDFVHS